MSSTSGTPWLLVRQWLHDAVTRQKQCPACGAAFDCSMIGCWCADVHLEGESLKELQARYKGCLCPACLRSHANAPKAVTLEGVRFPNK